MCAYKVGTSGNDSISGTSGVDSLYGMAGDDSINGAGGLDVLDGGSGNDTIVGAGKITGGAGNDLMIGLPGYATTFYVDSADDTVEAAYIDWSTHASTPADLLAYGNKVVYQAASDLGQYYMPDNVQVAQIAALVDASVVGNVLDNYIVGNGLTNYLDGDAGNDTIDGNGGFDILVGGDGNDSLIGNGYLLGADGNDTLNGSGALFGGTGDDLIIGGSGADTIVADQGSDTVDGGDGADLYMLGFYENGETDATDVINDTGTSGRDTVEAQCNVDISKFTGVEDIILDDGDNYNATGDAGNNSITGNTYNNKLAGGGGNDTLSGDAGNDTLLGGDGADSLSGGDGKDSLDGGAGADTMVGGAGNDVYVIDNVGDVVTEAAGTDQGTRDSVRGTISFTVADNVEFGYLLGSSNINLTGRAGVATFLNGNAGNNVIQGGTGGDGLYGGAGLDTLIGGAGSDIYSLMDNDVIIENADDDGVDAIVTLMDNTVMADNVEYLKMAGFSYSGTGNASDNSMFGNDGTNEIYGMDGDDQIYGYEGDDYLSGGTGFDTLYGGLGNDTYVYNRGEDSDTIVENDATVGNNDTLAFGSSISFNQLWLTQTGNNLQLGVIGTADSVTIQGWFTGAKAQVETITAGGKTLTNDRVQALLGAMAGLTPPAAGQTTLPANYQTQLAGALTTAWQ